MAASSASSASKPLFSLFNKKVAPPPAAPQVAPDAPAPAQMSSLDLSTAASSSSSSSDALLAPASAPLQSSKSLDGSATSARRSNGAAGSTDKGGRLKGTGSMFALKSTVSTSQASSSEAQGSSSMGRVSSLPTSRSRTRSQSIDDDDDDLVILPSTSARPTNKKLKTLAKATSRGSTRSSTPIITIPDSPPPKKAATSFLPLSQLHRVSREKRKANEPVEARWPTEEEHGTLANGRTYTQQPTRWQDASSSYKGKEKMVDQEEEQQSILEQMASSYASAESRSPSIKAPRLHHQQLSSVHPHLPSYPSHPLLDRIAEPFKADPLRRADFARSHGQNPASELWSVKYAPKSASEMLGTISGQSARYLKDWLSELAILGAGDASGDGQRRRRTVNRGAKHPRKKKRRGGDSDLDDFLASDEEGDDGDLSDGSAVGSDSDDGSGPSFRPAGSSSRHPVFRSLTNLILLVGPTGSGKTSAVHAVATEMDWSVFEVYPGIGKRGAKDVERYVGDVGKNHMVRGGGAGSPRKLSTAGSMFDMFRKPQGTEQVAAAVPAPAAATQSVILFDEVDVLYREEKDFWSGLIALAKQSRRPIVLTCTDTAMVPLDELGLQLVDQGNDISLPYLTFDAPESSVAVPFLSLVSLHEGHVLESSAVAALYESTKRDLAPPWLIRGPADPLPQPFPTTPAPSSDLRRALSQLQFECQWGVGDTTGGIEWMDFSKEKDERTMWSIDTMMPIGAEAGQWKQSSAGVNPHPVSLDRLEMIADGLSFADAFVDRRNKVLLEDVEPNSAPALNDEEISYDVLPVPLANDLQLPTFGRETEMAETLSSLAPQAQRDLPDLIRRKQLYSVVNAALAVAFRGHIDVPAPILPHPAIFTDYLPFIRLTVEADDAHAALQDDGSDSASGHRARRKTRSTKAGYARRLDWLPEELRLIRESAFASA